MMITAPLRWLKALLLRPASTVRAIPSRLWDALVLIGRHMVRQIPLSPNTKAKFRALVYAKLLLPLARLTNVMPPSAHDDILKILFIINDLDHNTHRYRVFNLKSHLEKHNVACWVARESEAHAALAEWADILIVCRTALTLNLSVVIAAFKHFGKPTVFDLDDLVFDSERACFIRHMQELSRAEFDAAVEGLKRFKATLLECDLVTTSTYPLRLEAIRLGKVSFVIPNSLNRASLPKTAEVDHVRDIAPRVKVTYLSGTRTHDFDFSLCCGALARLLEKYSSMELHIVGSIDVPSDLSRFGVRIIKLPVLPHQKMLAYLGGMDINLAPLEPTNIFTNCKSELKLFEAAAFSVPTVASPTGPYAGAIQHGHNGFLAATEDEWFSAISTMIDDADLRAKIGKNARETIARRFDSGQISSEMVTLLRALQHQTWRKFLPLLDNQVPVSAQPTISVIAVLYNKAKEIRYFLESLARQDFTRSFEIVLINDASPDDTVEVVADYVRWMAYMPRGERVMNVRIIDNPGNQGNCMSRNRGIAEAKGNVVIVVDADCMLNASYLSAVHSAFAKGDCDVVVGPMNIETNGEDPLSVLGRHDIDQNLSEAAHIPQDSMILDSFVNCITRNFAISRSFLSKMPRGELFDVLFTYSARPDSGFGWEDVDMGYRVYRAGARIKYLPETVSIHVSHPPLMDEHQKPLRSLKNYRRLHEKHPQLHLEARPWSIKTYEAITGWARRNRFDLGTNDDYLFLERVFRQYRQAPVVIAPRQSLRILTYRWHCAHQFELFRSGHEFSLVRGAGTGMCDSWWWGQRPLPRNARFIDRDKVRAKDYDLLILPFDENVLHYELCNNVISPDWGLTIQWLMENIKLPKIAICHGTPQFQGQYNGPCDESLRGQVIEWSRKELVEFMRDATVVCNSHEAQKEWGFRRSKVIWHGFSPSDWPPGTHDRWLLAIRGDAIKHRPHYNGRFVNDAVLEKIGGIVPFDHLTVPDPPVSYIANTQEWAISKFQNYAREIGRYRTYLNPTLRSPMPRSRGEAMMAGVATVSARNHDVDMFIENGVNGFFADTPDELAEQILYLYRNPSKCEQMQRASRQTALDVFNLDRYLGEWSNLLKEVAG